jgi:hypothetical protein
VVGVSEDPRPDVSPDLPVSPDVAPVGPDVGQDVGSARTARLGDMVVSRLSDQARLTAQGARARRVTSTDGQPGMADLTPLRELLADLVEEARRVRPRERVARALRQAADVLDPPDG